MTTAEFISVVGNGLNECALFSAGAYLAASHRLSGVRYSIACNSRYMPRAAFAFTARVSGAAPPVIG
jgi:hypothetical protein